MRKLLTEDELKEFGIWMQKVDKGEVVVGDINCSYQEYFAINVLKKDITPTEELLRLNKEEMRKEMKSEPTINIPSNPGKITCTKCLEDKKVSNKRWKRLIEKKGMAGVDNYVCKNCKGGKKNEKENKPQ